MPHIKTIALGSFGVIFLGTIAIAVFLTIAGDDFYRWIMRQAIEGTIDREIRVEGSFSFSVGLEPSVTVTDVWLENAPWANTKEMARAKRVEVQIALLPLFSGIVRVPRLVVEGLDVTLERSSDGRGNWVFAGAPGDDRESVIEDDISLPLFGFVSLKDIAITYRDHEAGRDMEFLLDFLDKQEHAEDARPDIRAEGSLNRRLFQLSGRVGSIQEALSATAPYPLELMLQSSGLVVDLTGTARNLAAGEGFDLSLDVRTPAIGEVLRTFKIDVPLVGVAEASARLHGDLGSLALEDLALEVIDRSGGEFRAEGRFDDLTNGRGLDLRFAGKLGPDARRQLGHLPDALSEVLAEMVQMELEGRISGHLGALAATDLQARLRHASGAQLSLKGRAALDATGEGPTITDLDITALASLPDQALLEQALGSPLPDVGAIAAAAELAWTEDWITLRSAEVEIAALERLRFTAEGRIGRLSGDDFALELDPRIDLSVAVDNSRPLVYLVEALAKEADAGADPTADPSAPPQPVPAVDNQRDFVLQIQKGLEAAGSDPGWLDGQMGPKTRAAIEGYQARNGLPVDGRATVELLHHLQGDAGGPATRNPLPRPSEISELAASLPELGPVTATVRLSREGEDYRFDDLNLTLGATEGPRIAVTGALGTLRPERDVPLEEIALQVTFGVPSSQVFAQAFAPELPEFTEVDGGFRLTGTMEELLLSDARLTAQGPDGLIVSVEGGVATLSLGEGLATRNLALQLEARWPDSQGIAKLVDLDLPELGRIEARATLRDRDHTFALTDISAIAGPADRPRARVTGQIGDLPALRQVELQGDFDVPTAILLQGEAPLSEAGLGQVHGRFNLSDKDGSLGLEALSAELEDTTLLSLSVRGLFDDIERSDELWVEATLTVPDVSQLGREFGVDAEPIGSLSFRGEVTGSDESFHAEGEARVGETDLIGRLSGTLKGERPSLRAELYSPFFRLADLGLVPQADDPEALIPSAPEPRPERDEATDELVFGEAPIAFETLTAFDLDLDVLLDDMEGMRLDFDKAEAHVDLVDGLLRVEPLSFDFVGGRVDVTLQVDASQDMPALRLRLAADDVDLGDFLLQTDVEVPLDGELDLLVDLNATGQSPRALASSLAGEFDLAIERGHVRTNLLRLTTTNPVSWLFTEAARRGYSEMNCLILRFNVQDGVAESEVVLLDTPNILALGDGRIDLRNEIIDIDVRPQAKRRRLVALSTPFAIRGPLNGPSVEIGTGGAAVRTAGEVLLSPLNLLGSLLPFVSDRGRDEDNPCLALESGFSRQ